MKIPNPELSRRRFLRTALAAAAVASTARSPANPPASAVRRRIKLGVIGNGGRGHWIAGLFRQHGGFEIHAVADYFQDVADQCGDVYGVDKARRFSGLAGYKRLFASSVEAVAVENLPCFFPEQVAAAVEAGLHIYLAKPVAVDVPGALRILAAGQRATQQHLCLLVDYQIPTDPANTEIVQRIRDGALGPLAQISTVGICTCHDDPPKTATIESRIQHLIWDNDIALGGGYINCFDIHAIDAALWVTGQRPVAAQGASGICRPDPHGDSPDVVSLVFEYADGLVHNHFGQALCNNPEEGTGLFCRLHGQTANALIPYSGKAFIRGGKHFVGRVDNLYAAGAERNIGMFYRNIVEGRFENPTVPRAVDGVLTCVLGREAAARRGKLTMDQLLRENGKPDLDLTGLKI
jgi:predicted dehydrogenase